ncbi:TNF receptor-associated factor homolog 1a-like isoform X2 [Apium graveolens]|uniref:TNF receptor-associated factor homolog 1a-like isoform X2 n=1 Tax=Apium graveolens TaxID=4045 RepID=UPI003D79A6EB
MAGTANEDFAVGRSFEVSVGGQQHSQATSEALAEWRSSEQVENGSPSTSPPYWDTDDDDDGGPKPSELYYKFTWKIEKFSQINKRELKSNAFKVGDYNWYILIYPQGCDVCNHLSLFLCVANHDKLLPGWSHFAQFTIAVVNKDPKKSKYSDTLHRFWKKEHDWGWKKFMELSKVLDGFIDADTLIIKAQVQVIRERVDRPFRCLDYQYRRELVRVYLTNVEQICRRFVEERRGKLVKLLEDKVRWSSFCDFWLGIDQNARRRMSREKTDSMLKVVVKHFFIEKEVTSTLVMDSLYSGLKALEGQNKSKSGRGKYFESELPVPIVCMEKDTIILVDDVLLLLERAAMEPLPPKDDKGPQNRTKDGGSGEDFSKDSIEREERRLTELGRRTIEIFVLAHIFSKIEVAYQEAVALKRQEELIREEEAAWIAESEQKIKRGAAYKEKKSKKKQGKHKKNSRKGKDKVKDEKHDVVFGDEPEREIKNDRSQFSSEEPVGDPDPVEDVSDNSDSIDRVPELINPDSEDRDSSPINWDTDTSEANPPAEASSDQVTGVLAVQNGERKSSAIMDDSSSTCSTDSLPSVTTLNVKYRVNSFQKQKIQISPSRGECQQDRVTHEATRWAVDSNLSEASSDGRQVQDVSQSCKAAESEGAVVHSTEHHVKWTEKHVAKKEKGNTLKIKLKETEEVDAKKFAEVRTTGVLTSPRSPIKNLPSPVRLRSESQAAAANGTVLIRKPSLESPTRTDQTTSITSAKTVAMSEAYSHKNASPKPVEKTAALHVPISNANSMVQKVPVLTEKAKVQQLVTAERHIVQVSLKAEKSTVQQVMSRPLSAPLVPGSRPPAAVVSVVQSAPALSRSTSAAGRLGPELSPATPSYVAQSYRNAMLGNHVSSPIYTQPQSPNSAANSSHLHLHSQAPSLLAPPIYFPHTLERTETNSIRPGLSFGMVGQGSRADNSSRSINFEPSLLNKMRNGSQWTNNPRSESSRSINYDLSLHHDIQNFDVHNSMQSRPQDHFPIEFPAGTSGHRNHNVPAEEFPHLDIINDLLDDEYGIGMAVDESSGFQNFIDQHHHLNRQLTFPGDIGMLGDPDSAISSCRFERSHSYHDNQYRHNYNSAGGRFPSNLNPQANLQPYPNIPVDGLIPNQWQIAATELPYLGMRRSQDDGLSYNIPNYSNVACGVNGNILFRPSNGR